jgi:DNA polymerase-3 subunit gamma/tau
MAPETVAAHLVRVLDAEAIPHDAGSVRLLSRAARGSMRDALSLTDQAIAYGAGALEEPAVRAMLGTVDRSHAERLVGALGRRDAAAVFAESKGLRELGLSATGTLEEMARLLQQMAVEQALPGALDATDSDTAAARNLASALAPDETQLLYSIALHGRAELSLAPDEYAGLVMILLRFMAFPAGGESAGSPGGSSERRSSAATGAAVGGAGMSSAASSAARPATAAPPGLEMPNPLAHSTESAVAPAVPRTTAARGTATSMPAAALASTTAPAAAPASTTAPASAPASAIAPPSATAPAPLMRSPVARATAPTVTPAQDDDDPPWLDDEPEVLVDDLPAPTRRTAPGSAPTASSLPTETPDREVDRALALPPPLPPFERTALGTRWAELVAQWNDARLLVALVRELAMQAELVVCADAGTGPETWTLRVGRETLRNPSLVDKLAAIARQQLHRDRLTIVVEAGEAQDSPARREAAEADRRQREAIADIQSDPTVQSLLAQFHTARILPGSIKPL